MSDTSITKQVQRHLEIQVDSLNQMRAIQGLSPIICIVPLDPSDLYSEYQSAGEALDAYFKLNVRKVPDFCIVDAILSGGFCAIDTPLRAKFRLRHEINKRIVSRLLVREDGLVGLPSN